MIELPGLAARSFWAILVPRGRDTMKAAIRVKVWSLHLDDDDTLYLKNREFASTPTSDIISYRMRRSKKLIIQGTDNGCGGMMVQKIKIREKNNLSCVHLQPPVKRQACIQVSK